jgi:hypothetical protein
LAGAICFSPSEQNLYLDYEVIANNYPGWQLNEIRLLSARQRQYWLAMIKWKREKQRV